jgi:hypothetical protein
MKSAAGRQKAEYSTWEYSAFSRLSHLDLKGSTYQAAITTAFAHLLQFKAACPAATITP